MNEYIRTELKQPVVIENIITVHYFEYTKNFAFSGEAHDFWEIVFADKGDLYITAGNSEFLLRQGQMFIHRPMEFHNIRCDGKTASNSVIVTFSCAAAELFAVAGSILRCGDETRYYYTEKTRVTAVTRIECEHEITAAEFEALLSERDEALRTIEKTRYLVPFEGHTLEIDVFPFWRDRAFCECELQSEDEPLPLPDWLHVYREVTDDPRYTNRALARSVPDEIL